MIQATIGGTRTISAPSTLGSLQWQSWSDGGAAEHQITVPATDVTIVATYAGSGGSSVSYLSDLTPSATPVNGWGPYRAGSFEW